MEAVLMKSTGDNINNHRIGNPMRNSGVNRTLFPFPSDDLLWATSLAGGHFAGAAGGLFTPPPSSLHHSYPPAASVFRPPANLHHYFQQPPLLPLPISMPVNHRSINISRSNSTPNNNIRSSPQRINKSSIKNRGRDQSLTPKKSKNLKKDSKKEVVDLPPPTTAEEPEAPPTENRSSESPITQLIGPDPKDLPKDVVISRVFSSSINKPCDIISVDVNKFSGSAVFTPSPPPSSLPLPTFSLRPKLSCKAEASAVPSGVDAGATDSLRRLLRL